VEQDQKAEEEDTIIPSKLTLTLKHVDDDTHDLGVFVIGDVQRDDEAHKSDTGIIANALSLSHTHASPHTQYAESLRFLSLLVSSQHQGVHSGPTPHERHSAG
jgi:hypothetical protein